MQTIRPCVKICEAMVHGIIQVILLKHSRLYLENLNIIVILRYYRHSFLRLCMNWNKVWSFSKYLLQYFFSLEEHCLVIFY